MLLTNHRPCQSIPPGGEHGGEEMANRLECRGTSIHTFKNLNMIVIGCAERERIKLMIKSEGLIYNVSSLAYL